MKSWVAKNGVSEKGKEEGWEEKKEVTVAEAVAMAVGGLIAVFIPTTFMHRITY